MDMDSNYYDGAEDQEELDLAFKVECRQCIERYGYIDRVKSLVNDYAPDELIEPLHGEAITAQKLQEYMYGYLLSGLDNPFGFNLDGMKSGVVELERYGKGKGFSGELMSLLKFARASLGFTHIDGREYTYDIEDFRHMMRNERKRLKKSEIDCNTTVKPLS